MTQQAAPDPAGSGPGTEPVDLDRVMTEIQEEVRRRRRSGDFPPSLERDLDRTFDRYVPAGALDGDFGEALKAADRASYINVAVPTASEKPGVGEVKRVLRKAMAWYLNYLAQQVTAFGTASVRALRSLGDRVSVLEDQVGEWRPQEDDGRDRPVAPADLSEWEALVCSAMDGTRGRVLHAESGDGALLARLAAAGVDAYGVDPRGPLVDAVVAEGLEAWPDDPWDHLAAVAEGSLGGLVISGCNDRASLGRQRRLIDLAAAKLAPGAPLVVVATDPQAWLDSAPALEVDLAPGRPLHATTWAHLLGRALFEQVKVTAGSGATSVVTARAAS